MGSQIHDNPASTSRVLRLQLWATTLGLTLSSCMMLKVENATPCKFSFMHQIIKNICKITFKLYRQGLCEIQMNFIFSLGPVPKISHIYANIPNSQIIWNLKHSWPQSCRTGIHSPPPYHCLLMHLPVFGLPRQVLARTVDKHTRKMSAVSESVDWLGRAASGETVTWTNRRFVCSRK